MPRRPIPPADGGVPKPARPARKNRVADSRAIEAHAAEFSFTPTGQLVWNGDSADWGSEYQAPPDEARCHGLRDIKDEEGQQVLDRSRKPLQERCRRWRMRGAALCLECAGGSEAVKRAVRDRLLWSADAIVGQLLLIATSATTADSDKIKAITTALDRMGIRGGIEVAPDVPGWQNVWQKLQEADGAPDS